MLLILAILPIVVTVGLGVFAGLRHQFAPTTSDILIQLVMHYALPLSLFGGILSLKRATIIQNSSVALWLALGMLGGMVIVIVSQCCFHQQLETGTLRALVIASPSIPFMGVSVLLVVFGKISVLLVALGGLYMNLVQVPVSVLLLTLAGGSTPEQRWRAGWQKLCRASRQPVVWAPISAFLLNLVGLRLPSAWLTNFTELGQAAGGVALFALGLLLTTRPWRLTRMVVLNVLLKNLGLPVLIWGIMASLGVSLSNQQLVVLTLAIPTATIATMLVVQNHLAPDEYVATQMLSTVIAPLTMGFLMWGLQLV